MRVCPRFQFIFSNSRQDQFDVKFIKVPEEYIKIQIFSDIQDDKIIDESYTNP